MIFERKYWNFSVHEAQIPCAKSKSSTSCSFYSHWPAKCGRCCCYKCFESSSNHSKRHNLGSYQTQSNLRRCCSCKSFKLRDLQKRRKVMTSNDNKNGLQFLPTTICVNWNKLTSDNCYGLACVNWERLRYQNNEKESPAAGHQNWEVRSEKQTLCCKACQTDQLLSSGNTIVSINYGR